MNEKNTNVTHQIRSFDDLMKVVNEDNCDMIFANFYGCVKTFLQFKKKNPEIEMVAGAKETGTDRIELYTESYARQYSIGKRKEAIDAYVNAAKKANELGLGINAGHDLDLHNLKFFYENIEGLSEVSIGHALITDALYFGLENAVQLYKRQLM